MRKLVGAEKKAEVVLNRDEMILALMLFLFMISIGQGFSNYERYYFFAYL